MAQFSVEMKGSGSGIVVVRLVGALDRDNSGLLQSEIHPTDVLVVDLAHLTNMTSEGAREFLAWSSALRNYDITFVNCPKFFIDHVNALSQFLPPQAKVSSFYVPYYSEKSGEEELILFEKNFAFSVVDGALEITEPKIRDSQGNFMVLDVESEKYFQFLSRHA